MIVAELVALVVVVAVSVALMRRQEQFFEKRLAEQDKAEEGRRVALYKQQKKSEQAVARSDSAVRKLADRTRHLQDEATLAHQRADALMREVKERG